MPDSHPDITGNLSLFKFGQSHLQGLLFVCLWTASSLASRDFCSDKLHFGIWDFTFAKLATSNFSVKLPEVSLVMIAGSRPTIQFLQGKNNCSCLSIMQEFFNHRNTLFSSHLPFSSYHLTAGDPARIRNAQVIQAGIKNSCTKTVVQK